MAYRYIFLKPPFSDMIHHIPAAQGVVILCCASGHLQHLALLPNDPSLIPARDRSGTPRRGTLMDAFYPLYLRIQSGDELPAPWPPEVSGDEFWLWVSVAFLLFLQVGDCKPPPCDFVQHLSLCVRADVQQRGCNVDIMKHITFYVKK